MNKFRARKVGPKGSNISGGEKQRAACARALARGGTIFLMDEGTSALDRRTELKLQTGVNEEFLGRTVINVAHRIETISDSNVIFVFDNGRLKEMGNYSELMMRKGYFYNFTNGNKSHD